MRPGLRTLAELERDFQNSDTWDYQAIFELAVHANMVEELRRVGACDVETLIEFMAQKVGIDVY